MKLWNRWNRRKLERELRKIEAELEETIDQPKADDLMFSGREIDYRLYLLERESLMRKAKFWGVSINKENWPKYSPLRTRYLDEKLRARVWKNIRDERRKACKEWAEVLLPFVGIIAAAITAAIAIVFR